MSFTPSSSPFLLSYHLQPTLLSSSREPELTFFFSLFTLPVSRPSSSVERSSRTRIWWTTEPRLPSRPLESNGSRERPTRWSMEISASGSVGSRVWLLDLELKHKMEMEWIPQSPRRQLAAFSSVLRRRYIVVICLLEKQARRCGGGKRVEASRMKSRRFDVACDALQPGRENRWNEPPCWLS